MPHTWNDERLDERFARIDGELGLMRSDLSELRTECRTGFSEVNARLEEIHARFDTRFDEIHARFDTRFDTRFDEVHTRFEARFDDVHVRIDGNQRAILQSALILTGAMMTGIVALFTLIATKL